MGELVESDRMARRFERNVRRATFRSMPAATMRALNRVHKPRAALTFCYNEQTMDLAPTMLGPPLYAPYRVGLGAGTRFGPIDVDRYLVKRLVALIDTELAQMELADDAIELALEHVLADPLERFEKIAGQPLQPRLIPIEASGHEGKVAFDFSVTFTGDEASTTPSRVRLWVPAASLPSFSLVFDRTFPARASNLPIYLPMHLLVGCCRLPLRETRALNVGDVLLLEDQAGPWPSAWLVIGGKRRCQLSVGQRKAHISGSLENYMSEKPSEKIDEGSLDDLEVEVRFELGRSQMPLGQLQMLAEGGVIPLERDYSSPVDVVVGGRRVGEGEIVDIDGKIGVRLVRFQGK